jgi:hypothetical protein
MVAIGLQQPYAKTKEESLVLELCLLTGRWLLITGLKNLEYISRIRILNNNLTIIGY